MMVHAGGAGGAAGQDGVGADGGGSDGPANSDLSLPPLLLLLLLLPAVGLGSRWRAVAASEPRSRPEPPWLLAVSVPCRAWRCRAGVRGEECVWGFSGGAGRGGGM